ncbi:MAG: tetratricopeptide repeat protein [Persephonella sp.]|nr:tetratricopeptide repeat protein [Persephonella sp.]
MLLLLVFVFSYGEIQKTEQHTQEHINVFKEKYNLAVLMYRRGSYYTALNILSKLILERDNPYYPDALFLSAKIYLHLGVKTGIKEFLHKALYYLNTYSYSANNPFKWEFYYIKGNIYENMFMYERALATYKMAFGKAKTKKEQFKTIIGILRTAAWLKRLDIFTRYLILVNLEELSETEKREFEFVKGLAEFQKRNYAEAIKYLTPVYENYEQYLIENPNYYLIIGENAYRLGDHRFAKKVFRRIISIVKDESVIRKATLRLGDIALKNEDRILAFNYYYRVLTRYPDTEEAKVAKLKLIALSSYKDIKKKLLHSEDKDFKDPFMFVLKTLVLNRNNYVGFFALGNFGRFAINSESDEIFKNLCGSFPLWM